MSGEWDTVQLGDICDDITVGHVGLMADEYIEHGIPFLRSLNVKPFGLELGDIKYISRDFHARLKKSALKPGDVVIVRTGRPGACAVIPDWLEEANCSDLIVVRPCRRVRPNYVAYVVNTAAGQHISAHTVGAVQQHFNVSSARTIRIRLPSLSEQDKMLDILRSLDDKIELNRRMAETLEAMARALFRSWFVDFDPVHTRAQGRPTGLPDDLAALFPDSFGDDGLPQGWRHRSVYDFARVIYGAPFASSNFNTDEIGLPLIRIRDLATHDPSVFTNEEHRASHVINAGDIVVGMDGEFRCHLWRGPAAYLNQRLCHFEPVDDTPKAFVALALEAPLARFEGGAVGTTVIHLGKKDLDTVRFAYPGQGILRAFGAVCNPLLNRSVIGSMQSRTLSHIRDTLLPKLISGELQIAEAGQCVAAA